MSRVLLAGDNPNSLAVLRNLFETHNEFSLCGQSLTTDETITKAEQLKPGLIILDFADWFVDGLPTAEALKQRLPRAYLFLLTERQTYDMEKEAVSRGIDAVFSKDEGLGPLLSNAQAACGLEIPRRENDDGL